MWKEQMIKDIEKIKFDPNGLFKNPTTNGFITRDEYINIVLDDFLIEQRKKIESLDGLEVLNNLELKINHNVEYITFKGYYLNELNCGKVLSQALLTYIYWKYKHPNCVVKEHANMVYIKKILGFKAKPKCEELVTPITYTTNCFICGEKATLTIPSYADDRIIFKCNTCNHIYQTGSDGSYSNDHLKNQYIRCDCKLCSNIKNKIHKKGIEWFNELEKTCTDLIENMDKYINIPNNNYMKKAYEIYIDTKNDERIKEILKHNPSSLAELLHITEVISNLYGDDYELLLSELKKFNIIFDAKEKINVNIKIIIIMYLLDLKHKIYVSEENFDKLKTYIHSGKFMMNYEMDKCLANESEYAVMDYDFDSRLSYYYNILNKINVKKIKEYLYEDSLFINPYFINNYNYKEKLIKQITIRLQNYSVSELEFVENSLDSFEKYNNKN